MLEGQTVLATSQRLAESEMVKTSHLAEPGKDIRGSSSQRRRQRTLKHLKTLQRHVTNGLKLEKPRTRKFKLVEEDRLTDAQAAVLVNEPETQSAAKSEDEKVEVELWRKQKKKTKRGLLMNMQFAREAEAETDIKRE